MDTRLPARFLRAPFGPIAKGKRRFYRCARLPLLPQAGAVALVRLLRSLLFIRIRALLIMLGTKR
jgi:hypothetical protein